MLLLLNVISYSVICLLAAFIPVSALKPEEMPEVRMETEEGQGAGYAVYHQKLVWKALKSNTTCIIMHVSLLHLRFVLPACTELFCFFQW